MTSSLVGSEMCIRDRFVNGSCMATARKREGCLGGQLLQIGVKVHMLVSVSYTHLTLPTICSV
eukprot:1903767-Prorocentrum_lima.AAC.1